jgi:ferrous iron transport protein A
MIDTFVQISFVRMDKRLSEIGIGKKAVIKYFEKDDIFLKLMEMGCVPGETIIVEQIAPLGDPICINVSGYSLSLRINEAEMIWVDEELVNKT